MTKKLVSVLAFTIASAAAVVQGQTTNPDATRCASTSTVFCSQFEEGSLTPTFNSVGGSTTPAILSDSGPFNIPGNHVMRLYIAPGVTTGTSVIKQLPRSAVRMYARWYQKYEAGWSFSVYRAHGSGLHAGYRWDWGHSGDRPAGNDWYSTWIEQVSGSGVDASDDGRLNLYTYYHGMYMDCPANEDPNYAGDCFADHFPCMVGDGYCSKTPVRTPPPYPPILVADRWYCIEIMLDGGSINPTGVNPDGQQNFWVDGLEIGPWTGLWHRTGTNGTGGNMEVNLFGFMLYFGTGSPHPDAGMRFDNLVVSTSRIGCAASAPAPSAPTNLRVIR